MPTAPFARGAIAAAALVSLAACRIERTASGRPPGSTRSAVDSLTLVEQDSASADRVRAVLRAFFRDSLAGAEIVESEIHTYGDVAQAWVVHRALTGADVRHGVDAITLERRDRRWRVVHRASSVEDPARPLAVRRP